MRQVLVYFTAILIHELFHVFAAQVLFREEIDIALLPSGFSGRWKRFQPERWVQCVICSFGPVGNVFAAVVSKVFLPESQLKTDFVKANLFIGVFNLIPLYPMDGGSILLILLYNRVGTDKTLRVMKKLGFWLRILLLATGVYIMIGYKNPSLLLAIVSLPGTGNMRRTVKHLNLDSLIRRRERILKKRTYQVRDILVIKDVCLGEVMLLLDYDKYHIIHIADENLNILKEVTEQQVIDAILMHNVGKTLGEVFLPGQ